MKRPGSSIHHFVQRIPADVIDEVRGMTLAIRRASMAASRITATGARKTCRSAGTERLAAAAVEPSRRLSKSINALAETSNGPFEAEVIHRRGPWRRFEAVAFATLEWGEGFDTCRLRESTGKIPPAEAEARAHARAEMPTSAARAEPK